MPLAPANDAMTVLYFMVALWIFWSLLEGKRKGPGYRCPSCNARSAQEHREDCAWKKHYGEEF